MGTDDNRLIAAVLNNSQWCQAVARAFGAESFLTPELWFSPSPLPRFYPNLITVSPTSKEAAAAKIQELLSLELGDEFGIKDSFSNLNIEQMGFRAAINGQWVYLASAVAICQPNTELRTVKTANDLVSWESSWANGSVINQRTFCDGLLDEKDLVFIHDHNRKRGCVLNRTGDVVGISNVFDAGGDSKSALADCISFAKTRFPDFPIVGWAPVSEENTYVSLGFEAIGSLRVWIRP